MKHFLIFAAGLIFYSSINAQCTLNGISTNPSAPVNNELPSKTNNYFDWRQPGWQNNSSCQALNLIESPFYKTDNLEILRASKDMQPEDGWELIRREFGYTDQHALKPEIPEHTYFVLYNKFTGILRVLLKTCRGVDYNGTKITIKFEATSIFETSLLDFTSTIKPLDVTFVQNPAAQSVSVFVNDKTKWFYADFIMAYDPCTCKYKSKLNIISQLIQSSQISLQGSITGTVTSITNGQGTVANDGSYSFKDFVSSADKFAKVFSGVDEFIGKSKDVVNTLPASADKINMLSGLDKLQNGLKDNQFLKTGLKAVPWLKSALGLIDMFSGGGKTAPQLTQLMPLAVNLTAQLSGSITTSNQYHNIIFSNPGSLDAKLDPDIYSFYNEVLGVFNFVNGPKFNRYHIDNGRGVISDWYWKLSSPIKWVLNPASKLQLQDAQVAYTVQVSTTYPGATPPAVYTPGGGGSSQGFNTLLGQDPGTGKWEYSTDYVDINCLGNTNVIWVPRLATNIPQKFFLKYIINLKRVDNPNAQNVVLVLKYPIPVTEVTTVPAGTRGFDATLCPGGMISQGTITDVNTFCASAAYTMNRARGAQSDPITLALPKPVFETIKLNVSPNPSNAFFSVQLRSEKSKYVVISLINSVGQVVHTRRIENISSTNITEIIRTDKLPNGIYLIKAETENGKAIEKVIVSR